MTNWHQIEQRYPGAKQALINYLVSLEGEGSREDITESVNHEWEVEFTKNGLYAFCTSQESASDGEGLVYRGVGSGKPFWHNQPA